MSKKFAANKVVIFGAASAIAQETARIFAERGCEFVLVDREAARVQAVAKDLVARGAKKAEAIAADLTDLAGNEELWHKAKSTLGEIDIVYVAHGLLGDQLRAEKDFVEAKRIIDVNFVPAVSLLTPAAWYFEQRQKGTIVAITSVAGDRGRQSNYLYGASKGALSIFLSGLRNRLFKHGVHVLTVKPGFVDTPMTAHLPKGPLYSSPAKIAGCIVKAMEKKRNVAYTPFFWWGIMLVIKHIPEMVFKKLKL